MAAINKPSVGLRFMVTTGVEKFNPESRKLIRSHVMIGKNLGKTRPLRKRRELNGVVREEVSSSSSFDNSSPDGGQVGPPPSASSSMASESHPALQPPVTIPRKFGSDASTICFADAVKPGTVEVVLQFSSIAKQILFPLEICILFERRAEAWIAPLVVDPAYLHAKIFTSLYYFDVVLPRRSSLTNQRILRHHLKTLRLLRERFLYDDDEARLSNNTVSAVLGLAGHAHWTGDSKSATHHMEGLCKIVNLRGGVTTFSDNAKLLAEILRCDLGMALYSGSKPMFFNSPLSTEPLLPYPNLTLFLESRKPGPAATGSQYTDSTIFFDADEIDNELARAWRVMSDFCSVINFAVDSGQRITVETFLDTMASVVYRLLDMRFEASSSDEAIRLGLLCFSCSVFLHWQRLGMSYPYLTSAFRGCLARLITTFSHISPQLMLWLLMAGAVSVFDASDDGWLKPLLLVNIGLCEIDSWSKMQDLLMSFLWIGMVHDKPGKGVFDLIVGYVDPPLDVSARVFH